MGPIAAIVRTTAAAPSSRGTTVSEVGGSAAADGGRALIAVAPLAASDVPPTISRRPAASFLAQLIATAQQAPQTRARRRAAPEVAIARYRATATEHAIPAGRRLERTC